MLCVITSYFNPCHYQRRRQLYHQFQAELNQQKVPCWTIECAFGTDPFDLAPQPRLIQIRAQAILWQKERLLNLIVPHLPEKYTSIAWVDGDVLFDNPLWAQQTHELLQTVPICQPWTQALRLNEKGLDVGDHSFSFAAVMQTQTPAIFTTGRYDFHGHTGYAWAMRRDIFEQVGLYEGAISGSSDHFMAHAIYNDYGFCVQNGLKKDWPQLHHLAQWGEQFHQHTQNSIGVLPGTLRHLWHGDLENRRYFLRMHEITDLGYNPFTDLHIVEGQPLEWSDFAQKEKPKLINYFKYYFQSRLEDGPST